MPIPTAMRPFPMPHGARPRSAHRAPALPAPTHRGRRRGSREVAHSCRPGGTMRASYVPTGLGPRTSPPGHRPRNTPPLACASRGCSARPRPPGRPGATVVTRALRARPEDRGPRGVRGRVARGTAGEPPPRPMLLCAPSPPTSEGPGEAPGPGCELTWILWDPRSLWGRLGGALCLPQGVSGALLRLCRGSSPAGGDGRGGALRAGAQARGAAVWLRPQVGAPPAGSRLKGKHSSPARCFPPAFRRRAAPEKGLVSHTQTPARSWYLVLCAAPSQPAPPAPTPGAAASCPLSLASLSGALICSLGGPRRKCL